MSTERTIELIHGEIDGTNSPGESAELRKIIERDDTAREFQQDMKRLAAVLNRVEDAEIPQGLSDSIRSAIASRTSPATPLPFRKNKIRIFMGASGLRLAAALAAGLVVGLIAGPRIFNDDAGWNPADLGGSMMPGSAIDHVAETVQLDADRVSGTIHATQSDARLLVFLDISAQAPVEVAVGYDPGKIGFTGFTRREGKFDAVEAGDGQFIVRGEGDLRCTLMLERLAPGQTTLRLEYRRDGALLGKTLLSLNGVK